ncbi:MAG: hypothetical protein IKA36_05615 [Clostridia bacterium]|nr:hypothetical protein [Clostridia bacterium]
MIYFISEHDCVIIEEDYIDIKANVKYELNEIKNKYSTIINKESGKMISINFYEIIFLNKFDKNINICKYRNDMFCFLNCFVEKYYFSHFIYEDCLSLEVDQKIVVRYKGNEESIKYENQIHFSHTERFDKIVAVFFEGKKNFIIILDESKLLYAGYYDEIDMKERELTLLKKLNDSINHGRVVKIEKGKFETFLIYLDNNDMNLKEDFCMHVFLDCVKAGNYKYLKNLLNDNINSQVENIKLFFQDMDTFFPIDRNHSVVIKKDAQMDIFEFSIFENKISNIIVLD